MAKSSPIKRQLEVLEFSIQEKGSIANRKLIFERNSVSRGNIKILGASKNIFVETEPQDKIAAFIKNAFSHVRVVKGVFFVIVVQNSYAIVAEETLGWSEFSILVVVDFRVVVDFLACLCAVKLVDYLRHSVFCIFRFL